MPSKRRQLYWDSCVFLSYIEGTEDRLPILDALLANSVMPLADIELVTSMLSVTEVAFGSTERENRVPDVEAQTRIDGLWTPGGAIKLVEFHFAIAREARELQRFAMFNRWSLKPPDAIHLATARFLEVDEFQTYDLDRLEKYSTYLGFPIICPYLQSPRLLDIP